MPAPPARVVKSHVRHLFSESESARTATGNTGTQDLPELTHELWVVANVTSVSGTSPTLTIQYQQQDANGNWVTVKESAEVTAAAIEQFSVGHSETLVGGGSYRIRWAIGGSDPSFTFQLSVQAR